MSIKIAAKKRMDVLRADQVHAHCFCSGMRFKNGKIQRRTRINLSNTISIP